MKFEVELPKLEHTEIIKQPRLHTCEVCGDFTRWHDDWLKQACCSLECNEAAWRKHFSASPTDAVWRRCCMYTKEIAAEKQYLDWVTSMATKDIIIVVHNQLPYLKRCLESIRRHTTDYRLYLWLNDCDRETTQYVLDALRQDVDWFKSSSVNMGFIEPNNELARCGSSEFIILLNSDTEVNHGWSEGLCGFLKYHPDVAEVGCLGGLLEPTGFGSYTNFGYDIDYLMGWCVALRRKDYEAFGLFDERMQFAYFEDVDLSLRIKSLGHKIYAFHTPLVHHFGSQTLNSIDLDLTPHIGFNHAFIKEKWSGYLAEGRVHAPRTPRIWGSPGKTVKAASST